MILKEIWEKDKSIIIYIEFIRIIQCSKCFDTMYARDDEYDFEGDYNDFLSFEEEIGIYDLSETIYESDHHYRVFSNDPGDWICEECSHKGGSGYIAIGYSPKIN